MSVETKARKPHLSVVAVSRNDDHGGDMLGRMQHFINGFIAQCRKHQLDAELILVEWNPPSERPPLETALDWPADFGPATVRIVTVPPQIHASFPHSSALPLFQMIGKNVGIRRACGRFVLATNIDILVDDAIVLYLRDRLRPDTILRADRYDVPGDLAKDGSFGRVLAECEARWFQVNTRLGTLDRKSRRILGRDDSFAASLVALICEIQIFGIVAPVGRVGSRIRRWCGDSYSTSAQSLGPLWHSYFRALGRVIGAAIGALPLIFRAFRNEIPKLWPLETLPSRAYWRIRRVLRSLRLKPFRSLRLKPFRLLRKAASSISLIRGWCELLNSFAGGVPRVLSAYKVHSACKEECMRRLHTNGCGDFTLLARDDWFRLRGYPEWPIFSWHIDSILMFAASALGIREVALNAGYRIYHIDHSKGSGWSYDGASQLFGRLDLAGIPYLTNEMVERMRAGFATDPSTAIVNGPDWGLIEHDLPSREVLLVQVHTARPDAQSKQVSSFKLADESVLLRERQ